MKKNVEKEKAPTRLMYVGPTVLGGLTQNTMYEGIPSVVGTIKEKCPLVVNLFIPIEKYPEAYEQIHRRAGAYYSAWKAVVAYKADNHA
jgi:hypothetical protein